MSKTEATKAVDYYRNKICVKYINKSPFEEGLVEFVEVFKEYKEAQAFRKKKEEDKTFVSYINLSNFSDEGIEYWIAIKAVEDDADVKAHTYPDVGGDDFSTNGDYATGSALTIEDGDMVHGVFDKITVAASDYVLAYRGR